MDCQQCLGELQEASSAFSISNLYLMQKRMNPMIFADVNADKLHEAHKLNLPCIYYSQITLLCCYEAQLYNGLTFHEELTFSIFLYNIFSIQRHLTKISEMFWNVMNLNRRVLLRLEISSLISFLFDKLKADKL